MKDNMVDCLQLARSNICPRRVFQTCVSEARKKKKGASSRWLFLIYLSVFFTFQHTCPPHPPPSSSASRSPTFVCLHRPIFGQPLRQWRRSPTRQSNQKTISRPESTAQPVRSILLEALLPPVLYNLYFWPRRSQPAQKNTTRATRTARSPQSRNVGVLQTEATTLSCRLVAVTFISCRGCTWYLVPVSAVTERQSR